jgi:hypothetical protein
MNLSLVAADLSPHPRSLGKCERNSMARYWNHSRLLRRLWHGRQKSLRDGGEAECARPRAQPRPTHGPCRVRPPVAFPRCCARGRAPSGAAHRGVPAGNSSGRAVGHLAVSSVRREFLRRRLNLLVPNDIRASLRRLPQLQPAASSSASLIIPGSWPVSRSGRNRWLSKTGSDFGLLHAPGRVSDNPC